MHTNKTSSVESMHLLVSSPPCCIVRCHCYLWVDVCFSQRNEFVFILGANLARSKLLLVMVASIFSTALFPVPIPSFPCHPPTTFRTHAHSTRICFKKLNHNGSGKRNNNINIQQMTKIKMIYVFLSLGVECSVVCQLQQPSIEWMHSYMRE